MIRLGPAAGYLFESPRVLAGWTPPATAAVYAVLYRQDPKSTPDRYAVIFVGHSGNLAKERFPFRHPRAACWISRAGSKFRLYIATLEVAGGPAHRETIATELITTYEPPCNRQRFDSTWKPEWIGHDT